MKLSSSLALAASAALVSADSSISGSSTWTWTTVVTNNGMTYTKTGADLYTGQATTEPTAGTYTTSIIKGSFTKIMTNTYGQATTISTHKVISGPDETYTKPLVQVLHTTEVSSFLSSHSSHLSAASKAAEDVSKNGGSKSSTSSGDSSSSGSSDSSSSTGGAAALRNGAIGGVAIAAVMLL